jgi:serine protease AprX
MRRRLIVLLSAVALLVPQAASAASAPSEASHHTVLADADGDGISDGLEARLGGLPPGEQVDVIVTWRGRPDLAEARRRVGDFEVIRSFSIIDGFAASMTPGQVRGLASTPGVFRVEENFVVMALNDEANVDYGTSLARADFGTDGTGVAACVLDTGADPNHEQLNDPGKIARFFDVINGRTTAYDDHDHGTHVAATLAGDGTGGANADRYKGVAPEATLYIGKVRSSAGSGTADGIIDGINWCVEQGADLISMSLGTSGGSDGRDSISLAVDSAVAEGVVVVVAAGNSGDGEKTVGSPGAAEGAITVGASGKFARGLHLAPFSSRGPTLDGRLKPDVVAPGVAVVSADANTAAGYFAASGTSMATPFAAGTVALMLDANDSLNPTQIKGALHGTATDLGTPGDDYHWGRGLLDGYGAVATAAGAAVAERSLPARQIVAGSVPDGGAWNGSIPVTAEEAGEPLGLTLMIDGEQVCVLPWLGSCLIWEFSPDLDVRLTAPDGTVYESRCPLESYCGSVGLQETIVIPAAQQGNYLLEVYAYNGGAGGDFAADVFTGAVGEVTGGDNSVPVANDDAYSLDEDSNLTVGTPGVLGNDFDGDGDALTAELVTGPSHGSLSLNSDGSFNYAPAPNYAGVDSFTYRAGDGNGGADTAVVSLTVKAVNDLPLADAGSDVFVTDSDNDGVETVILDGSGSSDVEGLTAWVWTEGTETLATGETAQTQLTVGVHTVTLTVTDTDGATATDTVMVTVEEPTSDPEPATTVHVGDLDGASQDAPRGTWTATVTVTVHDNLDGLVADATVSFSLSNGQALSCVTAADGSCSVTSAPVKKNVATVTFAVTGVAHATLAYDQPSNHDPEGDSTGTSISVSKP